MTRIENKVDSSIDEVKKSAATVTDRPTALETKYQHEAERNVEPVLIGPTHGRARNDGWQQDCLVFGGWPEAWNEARRLDHVQSVLRAAAINECEHLRPYTPAKSSIVKVKRSDPVVARGAASLGPTAAAVR